MKSPLIIGIAGPKQSGKDTTALLLAEAFDLPTTQILHFADPLKEIVHGLFGWPKDIDKDLADANGIVPRDVYTAFGTDFMHQFDRLYWVKQTAKRFNVHADLILIPDVRFDHEAVFIRQQGGVILETTRRPPTDIRSNHKAEQPIVRDLVYGYFQNENMRMARQQADFWANFLSERDYERQDAKQPEQKTETACAC